MLQIFNIYQTRASIGCIQDYDRMAATFFRTAILTLSGTCLCLVLNAQRIVCDETCKLSDAPPKSAPAKSAPGVVRKSKEEFQAKLREMKVDAVISGNGGCGLCTPKETGSCIAAEYLGIPSVIIAGPGFVDQARYTALNNGVPVMRVAEYPGAFATHTADELIRNTRDILWPQIVEALTRPISEEERSAGIAGKKGDIRDDAFYGTLDEINAYFTEMNWSDGLPIVPPTFEKVESFLKYTDMKWDETVAILPIAHRNTTVWHVAVNAVMAGCKPEYMPILITLTQGLGDGNFRRTLAVRTPGFPTPG